MKKDNPHGYKKFEERLIEMFQSTMEGKKDKRIRNLEHLFEICDLFHLVRAEDPKYGVPVCEGNRANLNCIACKSFKQVSLSLPSPSHFPPISLPSPSHLQAGRHLLACPEHQPHPEEVRRRQAACAVGAEVPEEEDGRKC
jgi:hypothetical protein